MADFQSEKGKGHLCGITNSERKSLAWVVSSMTTLRRIQAKERGF